MTSVLGKAEVLLDADRYADSLAVLGPYLAGQPDDVHALCLAARANLGLHRSELALSLAGQAVRLAPEEEWPLRLVSVAHLQLRQFAQARVAAAGARAVAPSSWRAHLQVAQIEAVAGTVGPDAWDAANEAVRLAPDEAETHRTMGIVALEAGALGQAEAALLTALRIDPHDALSRHELARLHLRQRNLGRAAVGFGDVAAADPGIAVAVTNLSVVAARMLQIVHLILWAGLFVSARAHDWHGSGESAVRVIAACAAFLALGLVGLGLYRQAGSRGIRLLRRVLPVDRLLAVWAGCLVAAFAGLCLAAPGAPLIGPGLVLGFLGLVAGLVASAIRARRLRRARSR